MLLTFSAQNQTEIFINLPKVKRTANVIESTEHHYESFYPNVFNMCL